MVAAWLAIAGVPPFSGFWSKDEILTKAFFAHEYGLWVVGLLAALLTGFYMTRLIVLVFFGNERWKAVPVVAGGSDDAVCRARPERHRSKRPRPGYPRTQRARPWSGTEPTVQFGEAPRAAGVSDAHPPHEAPPVMAFPVLLLAGLAVVAGVLSIPLKGLEFLSDWLHPVFAHVAEIRTPSFGEGLALTAASVVVGVVGIGLAFVDLPARAAVTR